MQNHYNQPPFFNANNKPSLYQLNCHPESVLTDSELKISVELIESSAPGLALRYLVQGKIAQLKIPETHPPLFTDNLWQHTCFEAFVGLKDDTEYHEFNFSPSGQWASYAFTDYRQRKDGRLEHAITIKCSIMEQQLILVTKIPARALPCEPEQCLEIGLTAVIETKHGQLSYWALHHPNTTADFHQRAGFSIIHPPI